MVIEVPRENTKKVTKIHIIEAVTRKLKWYIRK
jgi:hypothetical protein